MRGNFLALRALARWPQWANKIDSADYATVDEALLGSSPATEINLSLALNAGSDYLNFLAVALLSKTLEEVSKMPPVVEAAQSVRLQIQGGLQEVARSIRIECGDIAVFEAQQTADRIISRYSPYHFAPDARYSVGVVRSLNSTKITAMRNPWLHFESVPLGKIFEQFGGGGHTRVASVLVPPDQQTKTSEFLTSIITAIHTADLRGAKAAGAPARD